MGRKITEEVSKFPMIKLIWGKKGKIQNTYAMEVGIFPKLVLIYLEVCAFADHCSQGVLSDDTTHILSNS